MQQHRPEEFIRCTMVMRLVNGYQVSQALHVAAALGIADLLGAAQVFQVARRLDVQPRRSRGSYGGTRVPAVFLRDGRSHRQTVWASVTSSLEVMTMPLVSGPRKTATIYTISEPSVAYIIGLAKPIFWFTA